MPRPPLLIRNVLDAICILFDEIVCWANVKRLLLKSAFLHRLLNLNVNDIDHVKLNKLKLYVERPEFTADQMAKVSKACISLINYVIIFYTLAKRKLLNLEAIN
jgi:dynein heavy chain